jgi:hypothetical protein
MQNFNITLTFGKLHYISVLSLSKVSNLYLIGKKKHPFN